ncbi:hypothetical protein F5Y16DRAFT_424540 [Xylariaceae sp. FL0255]|nr:hypothetical protein F5Y16DRAFT_424540 [Xylariaceae sp. FL0255]
MPPPGTFPTDLEAAVRETRSKERLELPRLRMILIDLEMVTMDTRIPRPRLVSSGTRLPYPPPQVSNRLDPADPTQLLIWAVHRGPELQPQFLRQPQRQFHLEALARDQDQHRASSRNSNTNTSNYRNGNDAERQNGQAEGEDDEASQNVASSHHSSSTTGSDARSSRGKRSSQSYSMKAQVGIRNNAPEARESTLRRDETSHGSHHSQNSHVSRTSHSSHKPSRTNPNTNGRTDRRSPSGNESPSHERNNHTPLEPDGQARQRHTNPSSNPETSISNPSDQYNRSHNDSPGVSARHGNDPLVPPDAPSRESPGPRGRSRHPHNGRERDDIAAFPVFAPNQPDWTPIDARPRDRNQQEERIPPGQNNYQNHPPYNQPSQPRHPNREDDPPPRIRYRYPNEANRAQPSEERQRQARQPRHPRTAPASSTTSSSSRSSGLRCLCLGSLVRWLRDLASIEAEYASASSSSSSSSGGHQYNHSRGQHPTSNQEQDRNRHDRIRGRETAAQHERLSRERSSRLPRSYARSRSRERRERRR